MHHKDMEVWKQAMSLVFDIYEITEKFPKDELFGLTSQMERAEAQNMSNYEETPEEVEEEAVEEVDELQQEIEEEMNQQALDEEDLQEEAAAEETEE